MESARCKAFMYAADTGSFTKAAERLNYTPSGVSQLVGALENETGLTLLRRTRKGVTLTPDGEILLPAVREFLEKENRILVRQNSMKLQLEKSTRDGMDEKEPLIVATQLWKDGTPQQMKIALELAGKQISKWLGNGRTKANYYCPKEISSVFYWRVFLMNVLNKILSSKKLSNFNVTCGKWHEYAKKELGIILEEKYPIIADYDEIKDREFEKMINGKSYRVSNGNKDVVIGEIDEKVKNAIPIMTIHGSKGCTFDTTLVISTKNARSIGGHWKEHWLNGTGEAKRIGYVASTRAKYLLVWGVPKMNSEDKELLKSYGFVNGEDLI